MRSWCAIVWAILVMGCSGDSTEPPLGDSGSASYPTSDASGAPGDVGAPHILLRAPNGEVVVVAYNLTYGDIVWGQFKKNRVAYVSLWGVAILFLLAINARFSIFVF